MTDSEPREPMTEPTGPETDDAPPRVRLLDVVELLPPPALERTMPRSTLVTSADAATPSFEVPVVFPTADPPFLDSDGR